LAHGPAYRLAVGQQSANFFHIARFDNLRLPQAPFAFGGFFGQYVVTVGFGKRIFAATGFFETFGG
jgi:hypothetical protein